MTDAQGRGTIGIVPSILVIHFAVVVWLSATLNVWVDETYSMNTTSRDLPYAVSQALIIEEHPPFFFIVLWFWRQISESVFWGRMLTALCTLGFLLVAWRVVKRALPAIHPAWVIAPIAANPYVIYAGTEMRAPAMNLLLSGVLMWFFIEGFLIESPKRWAAVAYGVASIVALYTYYYLGFLLLANGIALLLTRRPRQIAWYYGLMAVTAIAYTPMWLALPSQSDAFAQRLPFSLSLPGGFRLMIERIQAYLWPSNGFSLPGKTRWIVPGLIAMCVGVSLFINRRRVGKPLVVMFVLTAVLATAYSLLAWKLGWRAMLARHAMPIALPAYLCVFGVFSLYADGPRRRVLAAWTAVAAVTCGLGLYTMFKPAAKPGDWKRVAEFIRANEQSHQPILVFPAMSAHPFSYHYKGSNEIVPIPRPETFVRYNHPDDALQNEFEIETALAQIPYSVDSAWVVVDCDPESCGDQIRDHNLEILQKFLEENYTIEETRSFFGALIQRCSRPGQLAASD